MSGTCCGTDAIWIDPAELKNTVGMLAEQAMRIQEAAVGTRANCGCDAPRSMVGWIDEQLVAVTEDALRVAVAYLRDAVDLAHRANEVEVEEATDTTATTAASAAAGGVETSIVGGTLPAWVSSMGTGALGTSTVGGTTYSDPLMNVLASGNLNPAAQNQLFDVMSRINQSQSDQIGTILAPNGLTMEDGKYVDAGGDSGNSSHIVEDPYKPGSYDIDP